MTIDLNINPDETLFYYYINWKANQENKIHKATCAHCNYGMGKHSGVIRGENGVWVGPFSSVELCATHVEEKLEEPATKCLSCLKN